MIKREKENEYEYAHPGSQRSKFIGVGFATVPFVESVTATSHRETRHPQTKTGMTTNSNSKFPVEIISVEEMSLIEAAFSAVSAPPSAHLQQNARSIRSISLLAKRRLSGCTQSENRDIEDSSSSKSNGPSKRNRALESFLHRYRGRRGLSVTDITSTEWCEKQMEFILLRGKPDPNSAMKAGQARHLVLEEEVVRREKFKKESVEDAWAVKFINFILGSNQLLFDGLTRELPIVGFAEGVWMVGVIDEIRMPVKESERFPLLVDTKTRQRRILPTEPQRRNGRLQLMCYKYLWDHLVANKFPSQKFFEYFSLNPYYILSQEIRKSTEKSGFPSETLDDLVRCFKNNCCLLPRAQDQLILRYEYQGDQSLLGEDVFDYEPEWLNHQIKSCLEVWQGERKAVCTPMEERWKCIKCNFASDCPANSDPNSSTSKIKNNDVLSSETPQNDKIT